MEDIINPEVVEAMGISQPAFEEIQSIIGRMPTTAELSTLLAMWESNGKQQSLYGWLKCQHHVVEKNDYIYSGSDSQHKEILEPRIKECISIAQQLSYPTADAQAAFDNHGMLIYMVGDVSSVFLDSQYAQQYLHLASYPIKLDSVDDNINYMQMITEAMKEGGIIHSSLEIHQGGVFGALVASCNGRFGFDILSCREVRLDAFLFGEERGRLIVSLDEPDDDKFLQKMDEARVNCCFLGRVTKGRILVDGMDFGDISEYSKHQ